MDDYISRMVVLNEAEHTKMNEFNAIPPADVRPVEEGEWIVRQRYEHYPSCRPYEELICPFCKRTDHNGDGRFCGYCGAKMKGVPNG